MARLVNVDPQIRGGFAALCEPSLARFWFGELEPELLRIEEDWPLLILRSQQYPEVGIAVSNYNKALGHGLRLNFFNNAGDEQVFVGPCGCCNMFGSFPCPVDHTPHQLGKSPAQLLEQRKVAGRTLLQVACRAERIKFLILHCWHEVWRTPVNTFPSTAVFAAEDFCCIDPYRPEQLRLLDKARFCSAFESTLEHVRADGQCEKIATLFA